MLKDETLEKDRINCIYSNLDTFNNKKAELLHLVEHENPDIICLTELVPKNPEVQMQPVELDIFKNYDCFNNLKEKSLMRGVVIYVKKLFSAQQVIIDECEITKESVWVEVALRDRDSMIIGCVYRSPNSTETNNKNLNSLISRATRDKSHILICGDFNYPEIDWSTETTPANEDNKATVFMEKVMRDLFLHQHVQSPTHYRVEQRPTLIDLILTNEKGMVENLIHEAPLGKSHHQVLRFDFLAYTANSSEVEDERFIFAKGDYDKLRNKIKNKKLAENMKEKDILEAWSCLKECIDEAMEECIPKRGKGGRTGTGRKNKKPLWWDNNALAKIKEKRKAFRKYMETREGIDYQKYAKARNQAKSTCRKAIKQYEKKIAKEAKTNPKAFYSYANSKLVTREGIADLIDDKGNIATSNENKAQILNNFFSSVFTVEKIEEMPELEPKKCEPLEKIEFTEVEVMKRLKELNAGKSPGPDGMHPRVLKELAEELAEPLAIIFTQSLSEGKLPESWKDANVTPLFKKGAKNKPSNYRPVSLTSIPCKVMEGMIRDKMMTHLESHELLTDHQHGFVSQRSCVTNLLSVLDSWTQSLDEGKAVDAIYLDFAKAFDSVPHERLLQKVESYGINANVLAWIRDFLVGRKQRVRVNGSYSDWTPVSSGVPQGSVLGPALFVIFINDLPSVVQSSCEMYADDTKVFGTVDTQSKWDQLQQDLNNLVEWADRWQLRFNAGKCQVLHLGSKNPRYTYRMKAHGSDTRSNLGASDAEKDLGVIMDSELKFSKHIETQVGKANKILGLIRRSYDYLDAETMRLLFIALIRPHLEFANVVWSPRFQKDKNLIEGVLRRATKLVPGMKDSKYSDRLKRMRIPSMQYRRERGDMIEVYKLCNGKYKIKEMPLQFEELCVTRGHSLKLKKPRCTTSLRQHFFAYRVVDKWNGLPEDVVTAPSLEAFKSRLDIAWASKSTDF